MLRAPKSAPSALIFDLSEPLLASQIDDQPRTRLRGLSEAKSIFYYITFVHGSFRQ